jgi:DinB superfamily
MSVKNASLESLVMRNEEQENDFTTAFTSLTLQQLNWKPSPESWSIAQCAEHLIKTNELYMDRLEQVLDGNYQATFFEKVPVLKNLTAAMLFWGMTTTKKLKAPTMFAPSSSEVSPSIINDFIAQHRKMKLLLQRSIPLKAENFTFTSPASPIMVFRLLDIFRISTLHSQRHLQQALRVKNNPYFPS